MGESEIKKFGYNKTTWKKVAKAYNETLDGNNGECDQDYVISALQHSGYLRPP